MRRSQRTRSGATPKNFDKWIAQTKKMARSNIHKKPKTDAPRRKSKRNSARTTPSPKNFEEMLEEAENLAIKSIYAEACAKKIKHSGPPFRLLDLPPELRMQIFDYMVSRPHRLQLRNLVAPLITAISKQVRVECMAAFFKLNTFQVILDTNICLNEHIKALCRRFGSLRAVKQQQQNLAVNDRFVITQLYRLKRTAGKIAIRASTKRWLEKINPNVAVFRNVDLLLKDVLNDPAACAIDMTVPIGLRSGWILEDLYKPNGRIAFAMILWHSTRLSPHFVSCQINDTTASNYYNLPKDRIWDYMNQHSQVSRTWNWETLKGVAYVVGHWGTY
jgi:hypothetical protein